MRYFYFWVLIGVFFCTLSACDQQNSFEKSQGKWELRSVLENGVDISDAYFRKTRFLQLELNPTSPRGQTGVFSFNKFTTNTDYCPITFYSLNTASDEAHFTLNCMDNTFDFVGTYHFVGDQTLELTLENFWQEDGVFPTLESAKLPLTMRWTKLN